MARYTYTNSPLVTQTNLITNGRYNPREGKIEGITIHHAAGVMSVKSLLNWIKTSKRNASFNYCVKDNEIGLSVEEKNRAWTSANRANDMRCVTIEVINSSTGGDWPISDASMQTVIKLCADICKRNGISKLYYDGTTKGTLTRHCMFMATACPGPYIKAHTDYICNEVNKLINAESTTLAPVPQPEKGKYIVSVDLPGYYTAANALSGTNARVTVKAGEYFIYNETDKAINVSKKKGTPGAWINKTLNVVKTPEETKPTTPITSTTPTTDDNPIGKEVIINGQLFGNSGGGRPGRTVKNLKTKITRYVKGAAKPYNTTGDIGWVAAESVTFVNGTTTTKPAESKPTTTTPATTPTTGTFVKGAKVKIKLSASRYSRSSSKIPLWVKTKKYTVQQVGNTDVLLKEIVSWVKKSDLTLV